jgi:ligand-binding sensor domain-containing protein
MKRSIIYITLCGIILLFISSCEQQISTSPDEPDPTNSGKLFVDSKPLGARIFINGKNTGQLTPDTIAWLDPTDYRVTLKLNLFKDTSVTVKIDEHSVKSIYLDYTTNPNMKGALYLTSHPTSALIFLNDSSTGKYTPATLEKLTPGYYNLRFKYPGYWDGKLTTTVKSGFTNYAQQVILKDTLTWIHYKTENCDIPSDYLNYIEIEKGYIKWIGTSEEGLIRFDDKTWTVFTVDNSPLPGNKVNFIYIDHNNTKWIGTDAGLALFDDVNWTIYNTSNSGLPSNEVTCAAINTQNNETWIGTDKGLVRYNNGEWQVYTTSNTRLPYNSITSLAIDERDNTKWVGTIGAGVAQFQSANRMTIRPVFRFTVPEEGPKNNSVQSIKIDQNGLIWFAVTGLYLPNGGSGYFNGIKILFFEKEPSGSVSSLAIDAQNRKWFGTYDAGIAYYTKPWLKYTTANSKLENNRIFSIAIDGVGNRWMASYGNGLIKFKNL